MENKWVVIVIDDPGVIVNCIGKPDKQLAIHHAVTLAMENGYQYGRNDAADILESDGRLLVGCWVVHVSTIN